MEPFSIGFADRGINTGRVLWVRGGPPRAQAGVPDGDEGPRGRPAPFYCAPKRSEVRDAACKSTKNVMHAFYSMPHYFVPNNRD